MAARDANAKTQGVTALRVAGPSKESIEKFKEVKARRDEARKKGCGDKRRGEKRPTTATPGARRSRRPGIGVELKRHRERLLRWPRRSLEHRDGCHRRHR